MSKRTHTSIRTTTAMRRVIQSSSESVRSLAKRYGINPKTVAKWRQRSSVTDLKTGPKELRSTVLTTTEEASIALFRQHVVVPLDDCLSALQSAIPHLTRSSLHRCLQRHDISRRPTLTPEPFTHNRDDDAPGHFSIEVTELHASDRIFRLYVATESGSQFVHAALHDDTDNKTDNDFLHSLAKAAPCAIRSVSTQSNALLHEQNFTNGHVAMHIEHRQHKAPARWNAAQLQRIGRTIKSALQEPSATNNAGELGQTIGKVIAHYNHHCKLRALHGLTPHDSLKRRETDPTSVISSRPTKTRDILSTRRGDPATAVGNRKKARVRDPENTREVILEAARSCLAHDGPEGLSMAEVARIAGVNRGTAYQHFKTRDKLIAASAEWVSDKLFRAVFGDPDDVASQSVGEVDVAVLIDRLSDFAMDNPELCRAWLLQVLSSPNPSRDQFWKQYAGSTERFASTQLAEENIDAEVLSVIMLAGAFLWPVWARTHTHSKDNLRPLAHRFAKECLRISMYGNLRSEHYPAIAERLRTYRDKPTIRTVGSA